jgi:hypothetical protein
VPIVADVSEIVANAPRNSWLALNNEQTEVVAWGDTPDAAIDAALAKGVDVDDIVLLWSPREWVPSVY